MRAVGVGGLVIVDVLFGVVAVIAATVVIAVFVDFAVVVFVMAVVVVVVVVVGGVTSTGLELWYPLATVLR